MPTRIEPEHNPKNGLLGAFDSVFSKYSIWNEKHDRQALSSAEHMFLMGLQSDLAELARLIPVLDKEAEHLMELIEDELQIL